MNPQSPEYRAWGAMIQRCTNPKNVRWADYGGRGIQVCARWRAFAAFLADMGLRPTPRHTVDRKDVSGNYEPGNCRWATPFEQAANKRNNRRITAHGRTQHLEAWSRETGLHRQTILWRLRQGWSSERALSVGDNRAGRVIVRGNDGRIVAVLPSQG